MPRVTLADVAARVGVSAKTVSNVVNGTGWVGEQTRERILTAVRELGYRPNAAARQLRSGTAGMLGLAMPDLREPYFAEFASRFVSSAQDRGITVLVTQTGGRRDSEIAIVEGEGIPAVDGLVVSPLELTAADLAARRSQTPLVLIGEHGSSIAQPPATHVGVDNVAAADAATSFLLARGRSRIAALGVQDAGSTATSRLRFEGYKRALSSAGIPLDTSLLAHVATFNRAEGYRAANELVASGVPFDGLFCFNDTLAFGALYSLGMHGLQVPQDVDVIGFDDIDEGRFSIPPFSTVNPGVERASELILDLLSSPAAVTGENHVVPAEIVDRIELPR